MNRVRLSFSLVALSTLAACGGYDTVTPAGQVVTTAPGAVVTTTSSPQVVTSPSTPPVVVQTQPPVAVQTTPPATVVTPGTAVVIPPAASVRPGTGRVESNTRMSQASGLNPPVRRVGVKMDDGTVQFFDTQAQNLEVGDRVELTADNHIRYGFPR